MTEDVSTRGAVGVGGGSPRTEPVPPYEHRQGRYSVRFARDERDLDRVFALRYEVFNLELGEGLEESHALQRDRDAYDGQCQHLMVLDEATGDVVGTYRMQTREAAERGIGFYSASEFDLSALPAGIQDEMIELGRACTSLSHRTRAVLNLLWRGMAAYLRFTGKRYFFGCSSLTSQDPAVGLATYRRLVDRGYRHPDVFIPPLSNYECVADGGDERPAQIPTLFTLYLRVGARVCSPPAIDRFFGTIDFLTLIDTRTMDQAIFRSYAD